MKERPGHALMILSISSITVTKTGMTLPKMSNKKSCIFSTSKPFFCPLTNFNKHIVGIFSSRDRYSDKNCVYFTE